MTGGTGTTFYDDTGEIEMRDICEEAGLSEAEISIVDCYLTNPHYENAGFIETTAFEKLLNYFADEMPYLIQKCRTGEPDAWILDRLEEGNG
jgi:Leu/Phe-tRNA-protein transferase